MVNSIHLWTLLTSRLPYVLVPHVSFLKQLSVHLPCSRLDNGITIRQELQRGYGLYALYIIRLGFYCIGVSVGNIHGRVSMEIKLNQVMHVDVYPSSLF